MRTPLIGDDVIRTQKHFDEFNRTVFIVFYEKTETWQCDLIGKQKMSWHDLRKKIFQHLARERQLELEKRIHFDLS